MRTSNLFMLYILLATVLLVTVLLVTGCSSTPVYVDSNKNTNSGRPFRMVICNLDYKDYILESYQDVATKVFDDTDKTVVQTAIVYPGKQVELSLEDQEEHPLAIYFLFTRPGDRWKTFLNQPLPSCIEFTLGENNIIKQVPPLIELDEAEEKKLENQEEQAPKFSD